MATTQVQLLAGWLEDRQFPKISSLPHEKTANMRKDTNGGKCSIIKG